MGRTHFTGPVQSTDAYEMSATSATPTDSSLRKIYTKSDDKLYFWNGSTESEITNQDTLFLALYVFCWLEGYSIVWKFSD